MNDKIFVTKAFMPPYEEYIDAIKPLWDSHWITNMGNYHQQLEIELCKYLDVSGLSLMVNGHMALELAIQMMGFPEGSEIITTPFTFISTTHAIIRNYLKPVFCDVKRSDGTIDETLIENLITDKTVAILPVHVYGNVCNVEEIQRIADKYSLKVIYDAAHAFGVKYRGNGIGKYGDASIFSFHATKVFNTIEGGAVTFKEEKYYRKLYNLKNFGIKDEELIVDVGANAKLNEFSAIMGLCNLKYIKETIRKRKDKYNLYIDELNDINGIRTFKCKNETERNYAYFTIVFDDKNSLKRDLLYDVLKRHNFYSRKYFYPVTADQNCFKQKYKNVKIQVARELSQNVLVLPLYSTLEDKYILEICKLIKCNI